MFIESRRLFQEQVLFSFILEATVTAGSVISIELTRLSPKFRRIGGSSADYYHSVALITINEAGTYTFASSSTIPTVGFVYTSNFDPENPSANLIAQDNNDGQNRQYKISVSLQATSPRTKRVSLL